jgi:hypothetical protein
MVVDGEMEVRVVCSLLRVLEKSQGVWRNSGDMMGVDGVEGLLVEFVKG